MRSLQKHELQQVSGGRRLNITHNSLVKTVGGTKLAAIVRSRLEEHRDDIPADGGKGFYPYDPQPATRNKG
jgi:hypothetical protein